MSYVMIMKKAGGYSFGLSDSDGWEFFRFTEDELKALEGCIDIAISGQDVIDTRLGDLVDD